jgi:hypothetical protein
MVSITNIVQKKAIDFFLVCNEYGSGGGSEGVGTVPSSIGVAIVLLIGSGGHAVGVW